jgi:hypothetical protein
MNRNFIFVFILLAALSLVNAMPHELRKRTTTFGPCPALFGSLLDVTISPDPVVAGASVTFTVSGTLKQDIDETTVIFIGFPDGNGKLLGDPHFRHICSDNGDVECPIKAGTKFTTTATVSAPDSLPNKYIIDVGIEIPDLSLGCAIAIVDTLAQN